MGAVGGIPGNSSGIPIILPSALFSLWAASLQLGGVKASLMSIQREKICKRGMFLQEEFGGKQQQGLIDLQFNLIIAAGMGSAAWVFPAPTHTSNVNITFLMCSEGTAQLRDRQEMLHQVSQRADQEVSDGTNPRIQLSKEKTKTKGRRSNTKRVGAGRVLSALTRSSRVEELLV